MFPSLCDYKGPCHKGKVAFSNRRYLDTQKLSVEKGGQTTGPRALFPVGMLFCSLASVADSTS